MRYHYPLSITGFVWGIAISSLLLGAASADDGIIDLSSDLGERVQTLPAQRTESQSDRVLAASLYTQARLHFQRREFAKALPKYQRAWRFDPTAKESLKQVVGLAAKLSRFDESARYAALSIEDVGVDTGQLLRLASYLTQKRDWRSAINVYRQVVSTQTAVNAANVPIHKELGRLYFLDEDFENAAKHFALVRDAVETPEKFGIGGSRIQQVLDRAERTYTLFGESFLKSERYDEALKMFGKANAAKDDKALYSLQRTRVFIKQEKFDDANNALNQFFAEGKAIGGDEPFEIMRKLIEHELGDQKESVDEVFSKRLTEIRQRGDDWNFVRYLIGDELSRQEHWKKACDEYDVAVEASFDIVRLPKVLTAFVKERRTAKVLDLLATTKKDGASYQELNSLVSVVSEDEVFAKSLVQKIAEPKEWPSEAASSLAQLALLVDDADAAMAAFELAYRNEKAVKGDLVMNFGLDLLGNQRYQLAAELFERAIEEKIQAKSDYAFYYYLSSARAYADQHDPALKAALKAAELKPDSSTMEVRPAWVMYHAKRYAEAKLAYQNFVDKYDGKHTSPEYRDSLLTARLILSNICVTEGKLDDAEEWLEQVLDEFPEHIGAMNDLGYLWADQQKHLLRSLVMVKKAVASEPENRAYRDSLGWAHYQLGNFDLALEALKFAADEEEPDGVILDHLGDTYWKKKMSAEALASWKRAFEAYQNSDDTEKAKIVQAKIEQHSTN
jgi:tetratricopeptide (TPR) repeat protein